MSIESVMPSSHLILCHPLLLPAFNLSQYQGLLQCVSYSHQMAKVLEFQLSIGPSNEYSGLISFRMDWLDLLAVQGTLKNLLQHHNSKASVLQCSAFFIAQFSHPYKTTGKTIALTFVLYRETKPCRRYSEGWWKSQKVTKKPVSPLPWPSF